MKKIVSLCTSFKSILHVNLEIRLTYSITQELHKSLGTKKKKKKLKQAPFCVLFSGVIEPIVKIPEHVSNLASMVKTELM